MNKIFLLVVGSFLIGCLAFSKLEIVTIKKQMNNAQYINMTVAPSDDLIKRALETNSLVYVDSNFCDGKSESIPADNDLYLSGSETKLNDFIVSNREINKFEYENKYDIKISISDEYHPNTKLEAFDLRLEPRDICIKLIVTRKLNSIESNEIVLTKEEIRKLLDEPNNQHFDKNISPDHLN